MTNRAGTLVSNLSGEMAYESFRPAPLPPNPPIEVSGELLTKLIDANKKIAYKVRKPGGDRKKLKPKQEGLKVGIRLMVEVYSL